MFYFYWQTQTGHEGEVGELRAETPVPLLHFEVQEGMGQCPFLRLTVLKKDYVPQKAGTPGVLTWKTAGETRTLFSGTLRAPFSASAGDFVLLVLDAGTSEKRAVLDQLLAGRSNPFLMGVLYPERQRVETDRALEFGFDLPHVHRVTGQVSLRAFEGGDPRHNIGPHFFKKHFQLKTVAARWGRVRCMAEAQWVQRFDGVTALGPALGGGWIPTLTPGALERRWWRKNTPLLRTGYTLMKSQLTAVEGDVTTVPVTVAGRQVSLPMTWMQPTLTVNWHYRQKRVETVEMIVPGATAGPVYELPVRLQDVSSRVHLAVWHPHHRYAVGARVQREDHMYRAKTTHVSGAQFEVDKWQREKAWPTALKTPHAWTFFNTDAGQTVVTALRGWSARLLRVGAGHHTLCVRLPFDRGVPMTVGDRVCLADPRLPKGQVAGVLQHLTLAVEGDTGAAWAEVCLRIDEKEWAPPQRHKMVLADTVGGVQYPDQLTAQDLLVETHIQKDGPAQAAMLQGKIFPHQGAVSSFLNTQPTTVRVCLKNLKTDAELTHGWRVEIS